MPVLQSYLSGTWQAGQGDGQALINPSTNEPLGTAGAQGLDRAAALRHARDVGGPALRALSYAERGAMLKDLSAVIHAEREALIDLGIANAGNTRGDAKFDVDGATGTLAAYAHFAKSLPDTAHLPDGDGMQLGRSPRFHGQHVWVARTGVAVHINAFNFPAWGMAEKMACALLAGLPVLEKPGTPTAMMAEHIAHVVVDSGILPEGAFSFLCGEAGDLLEHLTAQDCVAFTGSSGTARTLRGLPAFIERGARINVEADSLNAAVVGPDVEPGSETFDLFVREAAREITQKTGQKCTATRRIMAPKEIAPVLAEALAEALAAIKVGDPSDSQHRMGPLTNGDQLRSVQEGVGVLTAVSKTVTGGAGQFGDEGCFVKPTLLLADDAHGEVFHRDEVFGPVSSVLPYDGSVGEAAALVALGQGSLVTSIYSDDRTFPVELAMQLAPWSGRLYLASKRMADHGTGPGVVLPSMVHGGPGRAGGGEELGGLRGLQFYMQRTAIQGFKSTIEAAFGKPAAQSG